MERNGSEFAGHIADLCLSHYKKKLTKKGKPQKNREWTTLAAVVETRTGNNRDNMRVVAMGTGTKCIGQSQMCHRGRVINDSHAEVIARRTFLCYLYDQLEKAWMGEEGSVFCSANDGKCSLKKDVHFHLFTSCIPCGDASIVPKDATNISESDSTGLPDAHTSESIGQVTSSTGHSSDDLTRPTKPEDKTRCNEREHGPFSGEYSNSSDAVAIVGKEKDEESRLELSRVLKPGDSEESAVSLVTSAGADDVAIKKMKCSVQCEMQDLSSGERSGEASDTCAVAEDAPGSLFQSDREVVAVHSVDDIRDISFSNNRSVSSISGGVSHSFPDTEAGTLIRTCSAKQSDRETVAVVTHSLDEMQEMSFSNSQAVNNISGDVSNSFPGPEEGAPSACSALFSHHVVTHNLDEMREISFSNSQAVGKSSSKVSHSIPATEEGTLSACSLPRSDHVVPHSLDEMRGISFSNRQPVRNIHDEAVSNTFPDAEAGAGSTLCSQSLDLHRTGAKCAPGEREDSKASGVDYHTVGVLRTKPGRGERTLSVSCSDKIARWNVVGVQGAMLMHFLREPIYFDSVVTGGRVYSQCTMERATFRRLSSLSNLPAPFSVHRTRCLHAPVDFEDGRVAVESGAPAGVKTVPSSAAIIWYLCKENCLQEVAVCGRRLGVTAKDIDSSKARCSICKSELFSRFLELGQKIIPVDQRPDVFRQSSLKTYEDFKQAACIYQTAWKMVRQETFCNWPTTPRRFNSFSEESC